MKIREIYSLTEKDQKYDSSRVEIEDEVDLLVCQIRTLLDTSAGEVLGEPNFGASLEDMIFELNNNEKQISDRISEQISYYCAVENFKVNTSVKFFKGTIRDAAILDIFIDGKKVLGFFIK